MAFTDDEKQRILDAIRARAPFVGVCPVCQTTGWTLADGWVFLTLHDKPGRALLGGKGLPLVAMVCKTCGNTLMLNAMVLGLTDMVERKEQTKDQGA